MFGSKLSTAEARIASLTALLATIGFDLATAEDQPEALQAFVEAKQRKLANDLADAQARIETLTATLAARQVTATAFTAAFTALNIATPQGAELTPAAIQAAIELHSSTVAARKIAASGHEALNLPAAGSNPGETLDELRAQMATEKNSVKLGKLAAKAAALRTKTTGNN